MANLASTEIEQLRQTLEQQAQQLRQLLLNELSREPTLAPSALSQLADASADNLVEFALDYYAQRSNTTLRELERVDAALADMALGLYGVCSECEEPLTAEQLRRDPASRRCPKCEARHNKPRSRHQPIH